ncbi:FAD-binding oxidoreductase [Candidatus Methylacidithermus pantelleriae]|nr:FAD-binding oxidoreductase [Candidatus Methylacidithermus pantelleriae]
MKGHRARVTRIELCGWDQIIEYRPEDLTVTVGAGMTLWALQQCLAKRGQWLPLDPAFPSRVTIGSLIAKNSCGPRRLGYGTAREWVLGMTVLLGNTQVVRLGGKVVKNVAGYDLHRLFVGSGGSLGVILEVTFKVLPLPESELFLRLESSSLEEVIGWIEVLLDRRPNFVVWDLYRWSVAGEESPYCMVVGFAGLREEVEWEWEHWNTLGLGGKPGKLDYEEAFWQAYPADSLCKLSVLPSRLSEVLPALDSASFLVRVGNGIVYHTAPRLARFQRPLEASLVDLLSRVKAAFDPDDVLPELPHESLTNLL